MKKANTTLAKFSGTLSLIAIAVLASTCAMAQDSGWYGGANIGRSKANIDDARITSGLIGGGATSTSISDDNRDTAYKIYGGYQMNRFLSLEAGYFNLGQFGFSATTLPAGTLDGNIKLQGWNLDLVGTLPITEKFSAFARVGATRVHAQDRFTGSGSVLVLNPSPSTRDTQPKYGLGLQYALTESLAMRAELERHRINDAVGNRGDVDVASIGLVYHFGAKSPAPVAQPAVYVAPPVVYVEPAPLVVAPPPAPVAKVVPPPVRRRVSFSAESLFGFDKANLRPDGQAALDTFASEVRGTQFEVITIEGHTDRLGSNAYNQKLSLQRAESVKTYLVSARGLDASKIVSVGKGETMPVTKPEDCQGRKPTPKLIACLQADRRVDVEVTGTR